VNQTYLARTRMPRNSASAAVHCTIMWQLGLNFLII